MHTGRAACHGDAAGTDRGRAERTSDVGASGRPSGTAFECAIGGSSSQPVRGRGGARRRLATAGGFSVRGGGTGIPRERERLLRQHQRR